MNTEYTKEEKIAVERFNNGEKYSVSTFIDEDSIIAGYGGIEGYDFKYPLPLDKIIEEFGTVSWHIFFSKKGKKCWLITNKESKEQSYLNYWTEEEINEVKNLKENKNFIFEEYVPERFGNVK